VAQRKNLKWQVHEAVMDSELPPPARLLMFVFADLANAETGEIPEERKYATSLTELARRTGHGVATIKRHRPDLVALGWLKWKEPDAKAQSAHDPGDWAIAVGRNPEPDSEAQNEPPAGAQSEPPETTEENAPGAHSEPPGGSERTAAGVQSEPPIKGITDTDKSTNSSLGPNADASAPSSGRKRRTKPKTEAPPRADVEALCQRLAELMVANGCKPPTITDTWRDEARRMLDIDKRPFDKALALLEWCQNDFFWKSNIHSMTKFRAQYDQLRLRANTEWEQRRNIANGYANTPRRATTDERLDQADAALIEAKRLLRGGDQ
jgi:hypothetical protein